MEENEKTERPPVLSPREIGELPAEERRAAIDRRFEDIAERHPVKP